jgi:hypothetical protein
VTAGARELHESFAAYLGIDSLVIRGQALVLIIVLLIVINQIVKAAAIATIDGAAQDLPIVKSSLKVLLLVLNEDGAATRRHDMLIVIFSAVILFIRIVQVEGLLLVGAGAGDSAAHGWPAAKVDKLLRAADA